MREGTGKRGHIELVVERKGVIVLLWLIYLMDSPFAEEVVGAREEEDVDLDGLGVDGGQLFGTGDGISYVDKRVVECSVPERVIHADGSSACTHKQIHHHSTSSRLLHTTPTPPLQIRQLQIIPVVAFRALSERAAAYAGFAGARTGTAGGRCNHILV